MSNKITLIRSDGNKRICLFTILIYKNGYTSNRIAKMINNQSNIHTLTINRNLISKNAGL